MLRKSEARQFTPMHQRRRPLSTTRNGQVWTNPMPDCPVFHPLIANRYPLIPLKRSSELRSVKLSLTRSTGCDVGRAVSFRFSSHGDSGAELGFTCCSPPLFICGFFNTFSNWSFQEGIENASGETLLENFSFHFFLYSNFFLCSNPFYLFSCAR